MKTAFFSLGFYIVLPLFLFSCNENKAGVSEELIEGIDLKRGEIISCSPEGKIFGDADFITSCKGKEKETFNTAIKLLHSFEYDEAEKLFAKVIDQDPQCAMAYWGVAMSNFHPLWNPATPEELKKGTKAINIARSVSTTKRERDYIDAIAEYYKESEKADHRTRCINFEAAMKKVHVSYPEDIEAAIFYALAMNGAADPADKSYTKQKQAGAILNVLYAKKPNHPGIVHYIIHTYDSPELADLALPAARKYASVAPSSAHALHMPSHIFTRLGLWDECIQSNLTSVASAKCYAEAAGFKGHWDEELHGLDYLVYGYLQKGDNEHAKQQLDYLKTIKAIHPANFKVAYAFAAIPSRYYLENKKWKEAAGMEVHKANFDWENFQWEKAIIHFTRLLGLINTGKIANARLELNELHNIYKQLQHHKEPFKANKVSIQVKASEAWIAFKERKTGEAIRLMKEAADIEDETGKHPVTPGDVIPARELLGDLLMQMNNYKEALQVYEANLLNNPNRFNGLFGAGIASEKSGDHTKAVFYYKKLLAVVNDAKNSRPEINYINKFLAINELTGSIR